MLKPDCACGCIPTGNFANGLRQDFASTARAWTPLLLEKLKEKNTAICNNSTAALRAFFRHCVSMSDVAEDLTSAVEHKNPKLKLETLKLLQVGVAAGGALSPPMLSCFELLHCSPARPSYSG